MQVIEVRNGEQFVRDLSDLGPNDPLEQFLLLFLAKGSPIGGVPLFNAVHRIEDVWSVTWYRGPPFQIQMFVVPPGVIIPAHTHPNVDSFEVYVGGQIRFSHSGMFVVPEEALETPAESGVAPLRGSIIRVRPNDPHGGHFGAAGGVFMSVQHWLNGVEPHCVAADYTGPVMGPDHFNQVMCGDPVLKDCLTTEDATGS